MELMEEDGLMKNILNLLKVLFNSVKTGKMCKNMSDRELPLKRGHTLKNFF